MPRGPTRTSSSIWRPDPSRECAESSLHAPSAGGGRPYQSCGNGCIRVWYKRDHIEPRIGGPSTHPRVASSPQNDIRGKGGSCMEWLGWNGQSHGSVRESRRQPLLANDCDPRDPPDDGKLVERSNRSPVT